MKRILVVDSDMAVRSQIGRHARLRDTRLRKPAMAILRSPSAGRTPLIL